MNNIPNYKENKNIKKYRFYFNEDTVIEILLFFCVLLCAIPVLLIFIFIFMKAWPAFKELGILKFISSTSWMPMQKPPQFGIFYMIAGSLSVTFIAALFGISIGLLSAIHLTFFCNQRLSLFLFYIISLLASIPSVVYGFWGARIIVPFIRIVFGGNGHSLLAAGIILGIMILPTIIALSMATLKAVPKHYLEGSLALGSNIEEAIIFIVLKAAKPGLCTACILTLGRAIGETTAVVIVAGNANIWPQLLKPVRTLTANIALEIGYASGIHHNAIVASGAILFFIIFFLNMIAHRIKNQSH